MKWQMIGVVCLSVLCIDLLSHLHCTDFDSSVFRYLHSVCDTVGLTGTALKRANLLLHSKIDTPSMFVYCLQLN